MSCQQIAIEAESACLLVVDIQGKLAEIMHNRETLFANVIRMLQGAELLNVPVLVSEQNPEKLGPTREEFAPYLPGTPVFSKMAFSCAGSDEIVHALRETGRKQVFIVGIETHICVWQTVRDLLNLGFAPVLIADAVGSRTAANMEIGIRRCEAAGAVVASTEMVLMEMLVTAEADGFREMLKIIR